MKETDEIDKLFREGTKQDIPFDENLWSAVESQLPRQNYRRGFFSLNSILIGIIIFLCSLIPKDNSTRNVAVHSSENDTIEKINDLNTNKNKEISNESKKENYSKKLIDRVEKKNTEIKNESSISTTITANESGKGNNLRSYSAEITYERKQDKKVEKPNEQIKSDRIETQLSNTTSNSGSRVNEKLDMPLYLSKIELSGFNYTSPVLIAYPQKKEGHRSFKKKSFTQNIDVELEYGTSLSVNKKVQSENNTFDQYKAKNERELSVNNLGLNLKKQYKYITYGAGLHLKTYKEKVSYTLQEEGLRDVVSYDTSYTVINGNYNSNGNPVLLIKQNITEIRNAQLILVNNQFTAVNTFTRVSLPLFVGLQKNYKNWLIEARTAFITNYTLQKEGYYINDQLEEVTNISESNVLKSAYFSHANSAGVGYAINEKIVTGIRFSYEYGISSFTNNYNSRLTTQNLGVWLLFRP